MGMREIAARALFDHRKPKLDAMFDAGVKTGRGNGGHELSVLDKVLMEGCVEEADVVLKALYEPTNDVVIAMCTNDGGSTHLGYDEERRALRTWQRGIKAVRAGK